MGQLWCYLPFELSISILALINLSGLPFFWGFFIKHLIFITYDNFFLSTLVSTFLIFAALTGLFYSYKLIFYVFFDTIKWRKSLVLEITNTKLADDNYTNSTLGAMFSILILTVVAYIIIFFYMYYLINNFNVFIDNNSYFYKDQKSALLITDSATFFNFKFLNCIILLFVSMLTFLKWNNIYNNNMQIFNFYIIILIYIFFCFFNTQTVYLIYMDFINLWL
jgi:NADH:ubiquinone oxidoreductase subunit 5 (subunit L)/multisubunit Na+/H+ antiporter MnhA subunit